MTQTTEAVQGGPTEAMMADWYAVTDSDWDWDSGEDGGPAIVFAEGPEDAVQKALEVWKKPDGAWDFDGIQVKVALMRTIGFQTIDIQNGSPVKEPFTAC